ncbi:MAG: mobile mystery protein B [Deltaproteobacteria bacterium]|nr:mobile mystery protein B [Deltaproteobacteria bacterium]
MGRLKQRRFDTNQGKTPLDDTSGLLVEVHSREQLNALEFANVNKAITKYLLRHPTEKMAPFHYSWFLQTHREMFREVWNWAGQIRKSNKTIGIDKSQIPEALKMLEKDYHYWIASKMAMDEITARLHHRLVWIHPFENGNGRWARLITNIHLRKNELPLIQWPEKSLMDTSVVRQKYLKVLREADHQNFRPLMDLHRSLQK